MIKPVTIIGLHLRTLNICYSEDQYDNMKKNILKILVKSSRLLVITMPNEKHTKSRKENWKKNKRQDKTRYNKVSTIFL